MTKILKCSNDVHFENWEVYSTDEIKVGTWIDGKPIYRKLVINQYYSAGTYNIDVSSLNIYTLVDVVGIWKDNYGFNSTIPFNDNSNYISINKAENNLKLITTLEGTFTILIEYTKTTD